MNNTLNSIINNYLYFAYLPPKEIPSWLSNELDFNKEFDYSVKGASKIFDKIFDDLVAKYPDKKHLIPLSGGWDSRAILGALLERVDKNMIETVTFGVPGQLDYNIGIKVAKWAGVKCHAINLKEIEFTWDKILDSVKTSPWTYVPDTFFNQLVRELFGGENYIIWSGFLGGPISGSNRVKVSNINDYNEIFNTFVKKEKRTRYHLCMKDFSPAMTKAYTDYNLDMDFLDFIDLAYRQTNLAKITTSVYEWVEWKHEMGTTIKEGLVISPYVNLMFAKYWFNASIENRTKKKLYLEMLNSKYPELFAIPSKYSLGQPQNSKFKYNFKRYQYGILRRIQRKAPWLGVRTTAHLNYLDYDTMFRKRDDYKETLQIVFNYLKVNNITPWLNLDKLWADHIKKKKEYGNVFVVLIGLVANLKVNYDEKL